MNKKGFTLVELLVVTTIIMIITNIAYISYDEVRKTTRDNQRKIDLQLIAQSLESFKTDYGQYYHFSDYSYTDTNFLQTMQSKGYLNLLYNSSGECPLIISEEKYYNKYLNEPFQDPLNTNPYLYYYFADTYQISDCIFKPGLEINIQNTKISYSPDSYLPGIKKVFPKLEGCQNFGECQKVKTVKYNNLFKESCYGEGSNKVLYILAANLERKKSTEGQIAQYFKFCPNYKKKDKDFWKMIDYFKSLSLDYFIILEDIVDYWGEEESNGGGQIIPSPKNKL